MFHNAPHESPACNLCKGTSVRIVRGENFVECERCRLRFYSPRPTWQALIDKIWNPGNVAGLKKEAIAMYETASMWGDAEDPQAHINYVKDYYRAIIEKALRYYPEIRSIFEIGGSIGRFLQVARDDFHVEVCDGCEINEEAVRIAHEKIGLTGTTPGDFLSYRPSRTYDCVVALDYIEHTYHPNDDLSKACTMLKPGGVLVLKTFLEELDPGLTMVDYPWHSHHFFGDVLFRIVTQNGFMIVHWEPEGNQVLLIARKHEIQTTE